jgi:hypothetical protein
MGRSLIHARPEIRRRRPLESRRGRGADGRKSNYEPRLVRRTAAASRCSRAPAPPFRPGDALNRLDTTATTRTTSMMIIIIATSGHVDLAHLRPACYSCRYCCGGRRRRERRRRRRHSASTLAAAAARRKRPRCAPGTGPAGPARHGGGPDGVLVAPLLLLLLLELSVARAGELERAGPSEQQLTD